MAKAIIVKDKAKEFETVKEALDFIDKTKGKLNVVTTNQQYDPKYKHLISVDVKYKVTYKK